MNALFHSNCLNDDRALASRAPVHAGNQHCKAVALMTACCAQDRGAAGAAGSRWRRSGSAVPGARGRGPAHTLGPRACSPRPESCGLCAHGGRCGHAPGLWIQILRISSTGSWRAQCVTGMSCCRFEHPAPPQPAPRPEEVCGAPALHGHGAFGSLLHLIMLVPPGLCSACMMAPGVTAWCPGGCEIHLASVWLARALGVQAQPLRVSRMSLWPHTQHGRLRLAARGLEAPPRTPRRACLRTRCC